MAVAALLLVTLDRLLGLAVPSLHRAFLSSPGSTARYETTEFQVTAHHNALGLRGADLPVSRTAGVKRVLALGDSFTWGWGVADDQAWPAVLQELLRKSGLRVEVANGGQPGADPSLYAENAHRIIPVLKPDLVVVGILQGDDIEQLRGSLFPESKRSRLGKVCRAVLPNLFGLLKHLRSSLAPVADVGASWRRQAETALRRMSEEQTRRFAALDPGVQAAFKNGTLNPFIVCIAVFQPDYFVDATRPQLLAEPGGAMVQSLQKLASVAAANGSAVVVVSIPYPAYVSQAALGTHRKVGFDLPQSLLTSDVPDRTILEASAKVGLPAVSVTASFREQCTKAALFFPVDGHLNADGHRFLAEQLVPAVRERLQPGR